MALKHKLTRLEKTLHELAPGQDACQFCKGAPLLVSPEEADDYSNTRLPYDPPGGVCRWCRQPPPGVKVMPLSPVQRKAFAQIPWSANPTPKFIEKLSLILELWRQRADGPALDRLNRIATSMNLWTVEQQLERLYANDASRARHWKPPEVSNNASTHPAT